MNSGTNKVLYITRLGGVLSRGATGGAEVFTMNFLQAAGNDTAWHFDVLTSNGTASPYRSMRSVDRVYDSWLTRGTEQQYLNTKLIYTIGRLGHLIGLIMFVYGIVVLYGKARRLAAKNAYRKVYANGGPFSFVIAYLLYRRYRIPYIIHLHGAFRFDAYPPVVRSFYLRCLNHAHTIIVTSPDMQERIRALVGPDVRCAFVRNSVPVSVFKPMDRVACRQQLHIPPSALVVHSHNRLGTDKNIDILLEVIQRCRDENIIFSFLGDGYYAPVIRRLSAVNRQVLYGGIVENTQLPVYINSADLSWVACDQDNISLVAIESLYCGIPLLSCDISVVNDKAEHLKVHPSTLPSRVGYLLPERPDEIAFLLRTLRDTRHVLHEKKEQCMQFAHDLYGQHNMRQLYDILESE